MVIDPSKDECPDLDQSPMNEEELEQSYFHHLANGKKNLLCSDYSEAVSCFQAACALQSERFGDTAPECAEAFFYYGKSLLELARLENTVLGNALKGVPETEDSESETDDQFEKAKNIPSQEREQMRKDVETAMAIENDDSVAEDSAKSETSAEEPCTETEQKPEESQVKTKGAEDSCNGHENADEAAASSSDNDKTATAEESEEGVQEDPDDIPNMQLSWEMLEVAKALFTKKPESDSNSLMIAQCHLKLGEIGLEREDFSQAIGDLNECLTIQKKLLANNDRHLAETHYNLGLAYSFVYKHDLSLDHYRSALRVLERQIKHLNEIIENNEDKDSRAVMDECREVGEIKTLLPDINSKIEDILLIKRQHERQAASCGESSSDFGPSSTPTCKVKPIGESSSSSSLSSNQTATNDISHLIRRKRSAPENVKSSDNDATIKKLKTEVSKAAVFADSGSAITPGKA